MTVAAALAEVDALERLRTSFGEVGARTDQARRHDLVRLRRALSEQITRVSAACDPLFAEGALAGLASDYRHLFSRFRTATALHQASWPAVAIDDDPDAYLASARIAREAEMDFIRWIRLTLRPAAEPGVTPGRD